LKFVQRLEFTPEMKLPSTSTLFAQIMKGIVDSVEATEVPAQSNKNITSLDAQVKASKVGFY
jgi:hypothetical protein